MKFETRLVHSGHEAEAPYGDVVPPIHLASTYDQNHQDPLRYFYARGENPTRERLEQCLASLEDAAHALAFSSGQAAGITALSLVTPGKKVIASDDIYGGTYALFTTLAQYQVAVEYVDLTEPERLSRALTDDVALVWIETPTNPLLKVADVPELCRIAHQKGVPVLVDNTFASPVLQRPLELGADITLYSTTKFIAGHSDVIGGALVYNDGSFHDRFLRYRTAAGNIPGPLDCYLVHRGLKTLSLRVERQVANTIRIVEFLRRSPAVGRIYYPGLETHPQYELARRQMSGPGAIVTFEYQGDAAGLMKHCKLFACAVSLGSVRSLIECPALMTHRPIPKETRLRLGIDDNLIRLAVGIESSDDLIADLAQAMEASAR
jgi:cystathionine beta-lyase/cystathionine gamma-synthase